jgi:hypothetical protein
LAGKLLIGGWLRSVHTLVSAESHRPGFEMP